MTITDTSDMARTTFRIPDDLKEKMDQHDEINWSAFVRNQIKREVDHPNPPRKVKQFVHEEVLESENDVQLAWALHLLVTKRNERYRDNTASVLFQDSEVGDPISEIEDRLDEAGLADLDQNVGRDLTVKLALKEELADSGLLEDIKEACQDRIEEASTEIQTLVWLLARHLDDDFDREQTSVKPHSLGKMQTLLTQQESDKDMVTRTLTELGLIYQGYYSSNQYGYDNHTVPNYALALLEEYKDGESDATLRTNISEPDKQAVRRQLGTESFHDFLEWLDGTRQYVSKYNEDQELDDNFPGGADAFQEYAGELIREGILTVGYRPHRSSKGGNSGAKPARWRYEVTRETFDSLGEVLLERGVISMDG